MSNVTRLGNGHERPGNKFVANFLGSPPINRRRLHLFDQTSGVNLKAQNA